MLIGGEGGDIYLIDSITDTITELAGASGIDEIRASVSYNMGVANIELITLTGTGNSSASGTAAAERIVGNIGSNFIEGFDGADRLEGGDGDDDLFGGAQGDRLSGGKGVDQLFGDDGADRLECGDGDDFASGGSGTDILRAVWATTR